MRNRILLLLILASVLGTPVLVHRNDVQQRCANITDAAACRIVAPDPIWVRPFGLISAASLVWAAFLFAQAVVARRKEKMLLDQAGVHVAEEDLPLED